MLFKKQSSIATVSIVLIIVLSVGLAGSTFYFYTQAQDWKQKYQELNNKYDSIQSDYNSLEDEYNSLKDDYEDLNSKLNSYEEWQSHFHYYRSSAEDVYYWESMPYSSVYYWKTKERTYPKEYYPINIDLANYINLESEWSSIGGWAEELDEPYYSDKEYAKEALKFVHSTVYYMTDENSTGESEYWKYPTETLFDQVGDCEDTVFLYAALLKAKDIPCVILEFPEHVAIGVEIEDFYGTYYEHDGKKYFFAETTSNKFDEDKMRERNYKIGEAPPDIGEAYIHEI